MTRDSKDRIMRLLRSAIVAADSAAMEMQTEGMLTGDLETRGIRALQEAFDAVQKEETED